MKTIIIYNPKAANGKAKKLIPQIESYLKEKNYEYELRLTQFPHHASEITSELNFNHYNGIVAAGGDGTLFDVTNGYYKNNSQRKMLLCKLKLKLKSF